MEVLKSNFSVGLASFLKHVATAKYCAIDLELTGISIPGVVFNEQDSPQSRYTKMRHIVKTFDLIQVGFCLVDEPSDGKFILRPYNVYSFPRSRRGHDPQITMSTSAIEFNRTHNMDWNAWIREGVPSVTREEDIQLTADQASSKAGLHTFKANAGFYVEKLLLGEGKSGVEEYKSFKSWFDSTCVKYAEKDAMTLNQSQKFQFPRFATKQQRHTVTCQAYAYACNMTVEALLAGEPSKATHPFKIHVQPSIDGDTIWLMTETEQKDFITQEETRLDAEYEKMMGIRLFWRKLKEHRVEFIGHNCLFDILFLMEYLEEPLPECYEQFRKQCWSFFPGINCTKLINDCPIARQSEAFVPTASSHLGNLYESYAAAVENSNLVRVPQISLPAEFKEYQKLTKYHDAAYDAFCTAYLFCYFQYTMKSAVISMKNNVYALQSVTAMGLIPGRSAQQFPKLSMYLNQITYVLSNLKDQTTASLLNLLDMPEARVKFMNASTCLITFANPADITKVLQVCQVNDINAKPWEKLVEQQLNATSLDTTTSGSTATVVAPIINTKVSTSPITEIPAKVPKRVSFMDDVSSKHPTEEKEEVVVVVKKTSKNDKQLDTRSSSFLSNALLFCAGGAAMLAFLKLRS